ncbi:MAG: aerotolerance regulator BatA [Deltaproteobacteria bacterium CG07_land_8_20_14_0_80_38_7]|nr:MAG: aerotolerance regulator BatA [Deltaproteobacteria bacterium CG07_land_8_20_14_0_80_38_7]
MRFASPYFLLLLPIILPLLFLRASNASIKFSSLSKISYLKNIKLMGIKFSSWQMLLPVFLRFLAISLIIIALARPQEGHKETEIISEGIDIILTIDTSGSMQAMDFTIDNKPVTRLEAVKDVVADFIKKRSGDRIGMVVFGEESFTQAPLTLDHDLLLTLLDDLTIGMAGESTAIGQAIAVSTKRLKDLEAKSKVIVLLTDGRNNSGQISPEKAAEIAKTFNIKIYTIGVGTNGPAPFMVDTMLGKHVVYENVDLDMPTLEKISEITGARSFRATDTAKLEEIYDEIDKLEKSKAKVKEYTEYEELLAWFLIPGIILLILEILLSRTKLRKIP